jgi:NTP pyrophosphatase (non-canonical NTP hydrolase)
MGLDFHELTKMAMAEAEKAHWDDPLWNSFAEELAHIMAEVAEAFEAWRLYKDFNIHYDEYGVPQGVPIEFADVLLGLFYNVGLHQVDMAHALDVKHLYNMTRDYREEGRQLHPSKYP